MTANENNSSAYWQNKVDAIDGQITGAQTGLNELKHSRGVALEKLAEAERQERAKRQTAADAASTARIKRAKDMTQAERDAFLRDHRKTYGY